jgi:hypothetical protein
MLKTRIAAKIISLPPSDLSKRLGIILVCAGLLSCSPQSPGTPPAGTEGQGKKDSLNKTAQEDRDAAGSEDDLDEMDEAGSTSRHKKIASAPKPVLNTEGKKTGIMEDAVIVQQQNEFLGASTLKLSKAGVRLESSTIIVLMQPGKPAIAYNSQNGNSMILTDKSRSLLSGAGSKYGDGGKVTRTKLGTEKIAGMNCTHYKLHRVLIDPKSKTIAAEMNSDLWASKDLKLPASVMKDCARMTTMPEDLGFPVKITRSTNFAQSEDRKGDRSGSNSNRLHNVVSTRSVTHTKLDRGEFAPLTGFKTVTDEMQLMMASDESELAGAGDLDEADKEPVR